MKILTSFILLIILTALAFFLAGCDEPIATAKAACEGTTGTTFINCTIDQTEMEILKKKSEYDIEYQTCKETTEKLKSVYLALKNERENLFKEKTSLFSGVDSVFSQDRDESQN